METEYLPEDIIRETKKRVDDHRKKAIRYNILLSFCFLLVIGGLVGAIYYFCLVKSQKQTIKEKNESLVILTKELQYLKDSVQTSKDSLAKVKSRNDSLLTELYRASGSKGIVGITKVVEGINTSRDSARSYARLGYELLRKRDFTGAKDAFYKSEQAYNGYRNSYEIYFLLWQNKTKLNDPVTQRQLMTKIVKDYNTYNVLSPNDIR